MKEMQGLTIKFNHQYREGNQTADFLARMGKSGHNEIYDNLQNLPHKFKGFLQTDKMGLPSLKG